MGLQTTTTDFYRLQSDLHPRKNSFFLRQGISNFGDLKETGDVKFYAKLMPFHSDRNVRMILFTKKFKFLFLDMPERELDDT